VLSLGIFYERCLLPALMLAVCRTPKLTCCRKRERRKERTL